LVAEPAIADSREWAQAGPAGHVPTEKKGTRRELQDWTMLEPKWLRAGGWVPESILAFSN